jgi:hypothetical protein
MLLGWGLRPEAAKDAQTIQIKWIPKVVWHDLWLTRAADA